MTVIEPAFQRARKPEHKQQRHESILSAARALALQGGVRSVTLTDIAAEAGVHKSALLRYFETREEIFLQLSAEGWRDWVRSVQTALTDSTRPSPRILADALSQTLSDRPLFCDLLAQTPLNLERNVSIDAVREYKLIALAQVDALADLIVGVLPRLSRIDARDLIAAVTGLAGALWQTAHPPETLATLYAQDPSIAHAAVEFTPRLGKLIRVVITGLTN